MPEWLSVILALIAFVIILGAIICIHEAGHLYFAKKAGILCHEYSIGMGPVIYSKQFGETKFCIRAIPIGGFVSMAGEEIDSELVKRGQKIGINLTDNVITEIVLDENKECEIRGEIVDSDIYGADGKELYITINNGVQDCYYPVSKTCHYLFEKNKTMQITPYERSFESKKPWQKILTLVMGPVNNFILAFVLYLIVAFATGVPNRNSTVVGSVVSNYPAAEIGLSVGDEIKAINGVSVSTWDEFSKEADKAYKNGNTYNDTYEITFIHNGETITKTVEAFTAINSIGISNVMSKTLKELEMPSGVTGVRLGSASVRVKGGTKNFFQKIGSLFVKEEEHAQAPTAGDIISKVKIGDDVYEITSWVDLIKIFDETDVADIKFDYYQYVKNDDGSISYTHVTFDECATYEPYSNEVLTNQGIEKITSLIGVSPKYHFDFFGDIGSACKSFWSDFTLIFRTIKLLLFPSGVRQIGVNDMSSFVGIFGIVKQYISYGFIPLLSLAALLSVNIGVMNLLPIPALDGGRLVFVIVESITKKKTPKKVENIINMVFFVLLMVFFAYVTLNDIFKLF